MFCSGRGGHSYTRVPNSRNSPIQVTLEKSALTENRCAVRHVRGASMCNSYASVWPVLSSYRLWTSSSLSSWSRGAAVHPASAFLPSATAHIECLIAPLLKQPTPTVSLVENAPPPAGNCGRGIRGSGGRDRRCKNCGAGSDIGRSGASDNTGSDRSGGTATSDNGSSGRFGACTCNEASWSGRSGTPCGSGRDPDASSGGGDNSLSTSATSFLIDASAPDVRTWHKRSSVCGTKVDSPAVTHGAAGISSGTAATMAQLTATKGPSPSWQSS